MSRLTRDGTAKSVSRNLILRREREEEIFPCSAADHGQDWQAYPQLPPVIEDLGFVAGTLRGFFFPVCYGSVGVQLTRPSALCRGTLTSQCVQKNLNTPV